MLRIAQILVAALTFVAAVNLAILVYARTGTRLGVGLLTISVLMLSAAGIYAMMSFTVAQRTREIAIRAALGAAPHRLMLNVFGRASRQLALGMLAGTVLSAGVFQNTDFTFLQAAAFTLAVAAMMFIVSLLAAFGPLRRGLRVDAREALQADA